MTAADLKSRTVRDLALMARKKKVPGWHSMRKEELVKALLQHTKAGTGKRLVNTCRKQTAAMRPVPRQAPEQIEQIKTKLAEAKDLSFRMLNETGDAARDRLVVMVRDPFWLHAYWELNRKSIERAKVALGPYWHGAKPVLRLYEVLRDGTTTSVRHAIRDIEIHGGVNNWYIDVRNPPKTYQLDIGYASAGERFFCLARSNVVTTPPAASSDAFDKNWSDVARDYDRIFALSGGYSEPETSGELKEVLEERLKRPIGPPSTAQFGRGAAGSLLGESNLDFQLDAELIVHGATQPDTRVTLRGEPVKLRSDGTFAVRFNLPDRRHVLPIVISSADGSEQRTIVLAIDRNTKVMEPLGREGGE